ncbi:uncharacterized protein STAUR_7825 [Stigmatella aurantiaca DW4/3-1]|uniref:Uncharacterized protein n=1 Tax=Stigmatella aurantiaca (strain DW4/3-1) TaxID=378806 RepID=E3FLY1_STIAD|nr:uncharacterized protein STAUR_7825 [Stigmatella aurantiaca DW4/3-1]
MFTCLPHDWRAADKTMGGPFNAPGGISAPTRPPAGEAPSAGPWRARSMRGHQRSSRSETSSFQ